MVYRDAADVTGSRPESLDGRRLRVLHLTRRPIREHGGVERVVRGIVAAMAAREPTWLVTAYSAFRSSGGLEAATGVNDVVAAVRLALRLVRDDYDVAFVHCPECLWLAPPLRALSGLRRRRKRCRTAIVAVWHGAGPQPALVLRPPGSPLARALAIFRCAEERGALE